MFRPGRAGTIVLAAAAAMGVLSIVHLTRAQEKPKGTSAGTQAGTRERDEAIDAGMTETARVSLTLLDVEVVDKDGNPMLGLKKEDFLVRLNGDKWPIYSVDDLCSCAASAAGPGKRSSRG